MNVAVIDRYQMTDEEMIERNVSYRNRIVLLDFNTGKLLDVADNKSMEDVKIGDVIEIPNK